MEPVADGAGAFLAFRWPVPEAEISQFVAFNTKRVHNNLGGVIAFVAVDCLLEKISHDLHPQVFSASSSPSRPTAAPADYFLAGKG